MKQILLVEAEAKDGEHRLLLSLRPELIASIPVSNLLAGRELLTAAMSVLLDSLSAAQVEALSDIPETWEWTGSS